MDLQTGVDAEAWGMNIWGGEKGLLSCEIASETVHVADTVVADM
jgi:hypothetical protein